MIDIGSLDSMAVPMVLLFITVSGKAVSTSPGEVGLRQRRLTAELSERGVGPLRLASALASALLMRHGSS